MNPYKVLQLPETATYEQIKERYRHLSKLVHPDKHPIENYQLAQMRFKEIDQAYKSISSELRRYIYKKYGYQGITLLETDPYIFADYEAADLTNAHVIQSLDELLMYCLYEEHASTEIDKNIFRTKSIMLIHKPFDGLNQFPTMEKSEFTFETALPDFIGMSHSAHVVHNSEALSERTKSSIGVGMTSSKRINEKLMLNINTNLMGEKLSVVAGVDQTINNNLILHFVPINFDDGVLNAAQIGADYHQNNYYMSGITDMSNATFLLGSSPLNKSASSVIKFSFDNEGFVITPMLERDLNPKVRVFLHIHFRLDGNGNVAPNLQYGYKLKLMEELKLELSSFIGFPNTYLQIGILTPKFKAHIPILARTDVLTFELFKACVFVGVYLGFESYNFWVKKSEKRRKRIEYENHNRMSVEKTVIAKKNSDFSYVAADSKEEEIRNNGLIILLSYIGSRKAIERTKKAITSKINIKAKHDSPELLIQESEELKNLIETSNDDFKYELYEISESVQAQVKGSQLFEYRTDKLDVNPCMDEKDSYFSLVFCYLKGKAILMTRHSSEPIRVGSLKCRYERPWFSNLTHRMKNFLMN